MQSIDDIEHVVAAACKFALVCRRAVAARTRRQAGADRTDLWIAFRSFMCAIRLRTQGTVLLARLNRNAEKLYEVLTAGCIHATAYYAV